MCPVFYFFLYFLLASKVFYSERGWVSDYPLTTVHQKYQLFSFLFFIIFIHLLILFLFFFKLERN